MLSKEHIQMLHHCSFFYNLPYEQRCEKSHPGVQPQREQWNSYRKDNTRCSMPCPYLQRNLLWELVHWDPNGNYNKRTPTGTIQPVILLYGGSVPCVVSKEQSIPQLTCHKEKEDTIRGHNALCALQIGASQDCQYRKLLKANRKWRTWNHRDMWRKQGKAVCMTRNETYLWRQKG